MKRIISLLLVLMMAVSFTACGGAQEPAAEPVDLNTIYEGYADRVPDMMVMDDTTRLNFLGIQSDDCNQVITAVCATGLQADEVWLIEAKDEAALERIRALAETRMQAKADETVSYNPEQYAIVEKGVILTNGLYLAFLVSPEVESMKADFEAAFN